MNCYLKEDEIENNKCLPLSKPLDGFYSLYIHISSVILKNRLRRFTQNLEIGKSMTTYLCKVILDYWQYTRIV